MMDELLNCKDIYFPKCLRDNIQKESLSSFNMGFFGGNNLEFIKHYCDTVFEFFDHNQMTKTSTELSHITCNVIFEQVFFCFTCR